MVLVAVVVACGGAQREPTRPQASGLRPQLGVRPQAEGTHPVDSASKDDKCEKLIDRVVTLAVEERPVDQKLNDDERAKISTQLRTAWAPKCEAMTSKGYDCAVTAPTLAELDRCGG
jgi:hypothetical protein